MKLGMTLFFFFSGGWWGGNDERVSERQHSEFILLSGRPLPVEWAVLVTETLFHRAQRAEILARLGRDVAAPQRGVEEPAVLAGEDGTLAVRTQGY